MPFLRADRYHLHLTTLLAMEIVDEEVVAEVELRDPARGRRYALGGAGGAVRSLPGPPDHPQGRRIRGHRAAGDGSRPDLAALSVDPVCRGHSDVSGIRDRHPS